MDQHLESTINPEDLDLFYFIAGLYEFDRHRRVLEQLALHGDRLARHEPLRPWLLRMRAYCRMQCGDLVGSLRDILAHESIADNDQWARQALEGMHEAVTSMLDRRKHQEDWAGVVDVAEAMLAAYGRWPDVERDLGVALDLLGRPQEAEPILQELVRRSPLHEWGWHSLTLVLRHLGRDEEAATVVDAARGRFRAAGREAPGILGEDDGAAEPQRQ